MYLQAFTNQPYKILQTQKQKSQPVTSVTVIEILRDTLLQLIRYSLHCPELKTLTLGCLAKEKTSL